MASSPARSIKSWDVPADLAAAGFVRPPSESLHRLIVGVAAHEKSGKSHFALTAPGPIGYIDTDIGSEGVVEKFMAKGKQVVVMHCKPPSDLVRVYKSMKGADSGGDIEAMKKQYAPAWNKIAGGYSKLLDSKFIRTIVMDTATEVYETLKLVRFGKLTQVKPFHYGPVNDEYRSFIRQIYNTDKNLILIHKVKKQYQSTGKKDKDGNETDAWNGDWELAGYGDTKFLVQVNVQNYRTGDNSDGEFAMRVLDCRQNPDCAGLEMLGKECDFPSLAASVFEDTEAEDWK